MNMQNIKYHPFVWYSTKHKRKKIWNLLYSVFIHILYNTPGLLESGFVTLKKIQSEDLEFMVWIIFVVPWHTISSYKKIIAAMVELKLIIEHLTM